MDAAGFADGVNHPVRRAAGQHAAEAAHAVLKGEVDVGCEVHVAGGFFVALDLADDPGHPLAAPGEEAHRPQDVGAHVGHVAAGVGGDLEHLAQRPGVNERSRPAVVDVGGAHGVHQQDDAGLAAGGDHGVGVGEGGGDWLLDPQALHARAAGTHHPGDVEHHLGPWRRRSADADDVGALAFEHGLVACVEVGRVQAPAFAEPLALLGVQVRATDNLHLGHVHVAAHMAEGHEPAAADHLVVNRVGNPSQADQGCTMPLAYHSILLPF